MYDINKLKELGAMFEVEVGLFGEDQDKLQMVGTNGDINKFFAEAKRQGLLGKDPFDESYKVVDEKGNKVEQGGGFTSKKEAELFAAQYGQEGLKVVRESYDPEETSWMDALIDTLRVYPSNDEIENDAFLKELRDLYYKHYPDSDKIIEELDEEPKYWCVDGADGRVHVGYTSKEAAWQRGLDYYHGDSTQFSVYPEPDEDREDDEDYWNKIMAQEYHGEETLMERMDFDTLYKKIKYQDDLPVKEGLMGTLLFNTSFANKLYDEFYRPLTDLIKKGDKEGAMKEWEDLNKDFQEEPRMKKKWAKTFVEVQKDRLEKYKSQIDAMEDTKDLYEGLDGSLHIQYCPACGSYNEYSDSEDNGSWVRYTCRNCGNTWDIDKPRNKDSGLTKDETALVEDIINEAYMDPEVAYCDDIPSLIKEEYLPIFSDEELNQILPPTENLPEGSFGDRLLQLLKDIIGDMGFSGGIRFWGSREAWEEYYELPDYDKFKPKYLSILRKIFPSRKKKINYSVSFSTCDQLAYEECPYLIGESDANISISNRYELDEEELWATGWIGAVQNCNDGPFNSFDELVIYCYDQEKGNEYDLPEIPEDIKPKFLAEVNKYIEEVGTMEEGYKPHTKRLLKLIGSDKLDEEISNSSNHWTNHPKWKTLIHKYNYAPEQLLSVSWTLIPAYSKQMMDALSYDLNSFISGSLSEGAFERSIDNAGDQIDRSNSRKYNRNKDFDFEKYPEGPGSYAHLPNAYNYDPELDSQEWDFSDMPTQDEFFFKKYDIYYFETDDYDKYEIADLIAKKDSNILSHRVYKFDKPGYFVIIDKDGDCPYDGNVLLWASSLSELINEFDDAVANNYNDYELDGWDDYEESITENKKGYKPHNRRLSKLIESDKLNEAEELLDLINSKLDEQGYGGIEGLDERDDKWEIEYLNDYDDIEYEYFPKTMPLEEIVKSIIKLYNGGSEELVKFSYAVYDLIPDEDDEEHFIEADDAVKEFDSESEAIKFAKSQDYLTHVVFIPRPDSDAGPEYREYIRQNSSYDDYEIIWSSIDQDDDWEYDDYEESYTPISEDIDDDFETPSYKAENIEFVMNEYIADEFGVESVTKISDTTYKLIYDGTEVEIVFDLGWDEWVYNINGKGPFAHSSYEWLLSDVRNVIDDEPIQESYFEDEPSWLDDDDPVEADREHANLYGGDRTYCDTCGSRLAMDEWGSYCPKCNPQELEEAFDSHIDLDAVAIRVANLLDEENLGDNWIEFDYKDSRGLIGSDDQHLAFEAVGESKMLRGYMRGHVDNTITVYITNGSEAVCRTPEEIARFIAGEFGVAL